MAMPSGYCVRCESSLARLCFDAARARWYMHCFACGGEREIDNPCDYRRPDHLPVFLHPSSVARWHRAIAPDRSRADPHGGAAEPRAREGPV